MSAVKFSLSSGRCGLPSPGSPGYSQSTSKPSRSWRLTKSTALATKTRRLFAVSAASENPFDQVQPPTEIRMRRCGWSCRSPVSTFRFSASWGEPSTTRPPTTLAKAKLTWVSFSARISEDSRTRSRGKT